MGLLDAFKEYVKDAMPGGLLNPELTPQNIRTAGEYASMTPNPIGDVASGLLAVDDVRKGDYGSAALNSIGLLPFVPSLGYTVHKMGDIKILEEPTREMVKNLADKSRYGEVRGLVDPATSKQYWWDAGSLNHKDVSDWFGFNWGEIEKGSDKTRKMMGSGAINGTPWKFSGD